MELPRYELLSGDSRMVFEFTSEGPNGKIPKLIRFTEMDVKDIFNLAFGDKKSGTNEIDDEVISNNGDSRKVLATVANAVDIFTREYPSTWIYATGSTQSRNRLYQMSINKYLHEIITNFEVYGLVNKEWQKFRRGIVYEAFLIKRK